MKINYRLLAGTLFSILIFGLAGWALNKQLADIPAHAVMHKITNTPWYKLGLSFVSVVISFVFLILIDLLSFRRIAPALSRKLVAKSALAGYGISFNLGFSAVTGSAVRYKILNEEQIDGAVLAQGLTRIFFYFWAGTLTLLSILLILGSGWAVAEIGGKAIFYQAGGGIFLSLMAALIFWTSKREIINVASIELASPTLTEWLKVILYEAADWIFAALALYILLPASAQIGFAHFLLIFLFAQLFGLVSHVPGGLGVFEAAFLVGLQSQASSSTAAALLLFRIFYYLIPLVLAAVILAKSEIARISRLIFKVGNKANKLTSSVFPYILSVLTFTAGLILLTSGVTPASAGRIEFLNLFLPLSVVELSHFTGSIVGILLIALSRGLWLCVKQAYHAAILLLVSGAILSLLKGFDYEEAIAVGVISLLLYQSRSYFRRHGDIWRIPLTSTGIAGIVGSFVLVTWLLFFANKDTPYSNELWWEFTLEGDAARSIRAMLGVSIVFLSLLFFSLFSPKRKFFDSLETPDPEELKKIIINSPNPSAWLALLGDKSILFNEKRDAFIMYAQSGKSLVALSEPVGNPESYQELLWEFIELADLHALSPAFYQVGTENLSAYIDLGLTLFKLGEEAIVDLDSFKLEGKANAGHRQALRKVEAEGFYFRIMQPEEVRRRISDLREVSDSWVKHKNAREKKFSLGNFNENYLVHTPVAVIEKPSSENSSGSQLVAFSNLWLTDNKQEFSIDLMRYNQSAPKNVMEYLFVKILLWGKENEYKTINLGMAPLSGLETHPLASTWHKFGTFLFKHAENFYNFQGLRAYKQKFHPSWEAKYLASHGGLALPRVLRDISSLISGSMKGIFLK